MGAVHTPSYRHRERRDGGADGGTRGSIHMTSGPGIWHDARPMGGTATTGGVTLGWAAATDVGLSRTVNEDAVLGAPPVFVVADGMGGHQAGDVASKLVIDRFGTLVEGELKPVEDVVQLLSEVNETILAEGQRSLARSGMGTTAVGLMLVDAGDRSQWLLFNIGDSRAYRWAGGTLEQLSVDHSYVQELVDAGEITVSGARTHPHRNVVTRALGSEEDAQPDLWLRPPLIGERYLLCSDGLSGEVDDTEIARVMAEGSADDVVALLVRRALEAGGHDNVSVLVVDVIDVDDEAPGAITSPRDVVEAELVDDFDDVPTAEHRAVKTSERRVSPGGTVDAGPGALIDRVPDQTELEAMGPDITPGEGPDDATPDGAVDATVEPTDDAAVLDPDAPDVQAENGHDQEVEG